MDDCRRCAVTFEMINLNVSISAIGDNAIDGQNGWNQCKK